MKRIMICLLAAVMLFGGTARIKAEMFNKDFDINESALISSSAFLDGMLYLTIDGSFFSYAPAGQSLKRLAVDDRRTAPQSEKELSAAGLPADSYDSFILFAEDQNFMPWTLKRLASSFRWPLRTMSSQYMTASAST